MPPLIGITLGDANGVGPEILLRAHAAGQLPARCIVFGDRCVLEYCSRKLGLAVALRTTSHLAADAPGVLDIDDMRLLGDADIRPGEVSRQTGQAALQYLRHALSAALAGHIDGLVTLPMHKEATRLSAPGFTGHTDVIAEACGVREYTMTLVSQRLVVPHVSSHVSLAEAIRRVTKERVATVIGLADQACGRLQRGRRIAVMGLNPHAGEAGAFGSEEAAEIAPAVRQARQAGIDASGPLPPDTVFMRALRGEFDAVVCMYHDQGHIPMKTIAMDESVNVTFGLPIVRTSVDHGTAFDIAYTGTACLGSFVSACRLAEVLASRR